MIQIVTDRVVIADWRSKLSGAVRVTRKHPIGLSPAWLESRQFALAPVFEGGLSGIEPIYLDAALRIAGSTLVVLLNPFEQQELSDWERKEGWIPAPELATAATQAGEVFDALNELGGNGILITDEAIRFCMLAVLNEHSLVSGPIRIVEAMVGCSLKDQWLKFRRAIGSDPHLFALLRDHVLDWYARFEPV